MLRKMSTCFPLPSVLIKLTCLKLQTKFKETRFESLYCVFPGVVLVNVRYLHVKGGQVERSR